MSANFTLASQCQLKRDEIHELLNLSSAAKRAIETDKNINNTTNINTNTTNNTTEIRRSVDDDMLSQWCMRLTAAQVCSLMQHTLVRVSIPKNKQQLLVHSNKFMKLNTSAEKQPSQENNNNNNNNNNNKQAYYRVGKIVAVVPRPRAKSEITTIVDNEVGEQLSDWLLNINFGEVTELIGAKYVSNESFNAAEHTVYVRSCLTTQAHTIKSTVTAAETEMIARNVEDVRRFTAQIVGERNGHRSTEQTKTGVSLNSHSHDNILGIGGRKRPRDEVNAIGEGLDDYEATVNNNMNKNNNMNMNNAVYGVPSAGSSSSSSEVLKELQQQLRSLRELLNCKNDDMQRMLLANRQAEMNHNAEKEEYQAKVVSLGEALRNEQREKAALHEKQQQQKDKTDKLTVQLKRIVEHTQKYKQVSDTAAELLHSSTKEPEEVLRRLNEKLAGMK